MIKCLIIGFGWLMLCLYTWKFDKSLLWYKLFGITLMAVLLCWFIVHDMPRFENNHNLNNSKKYLANF
jgi:ABC-type nickel/cobalt efflux system permease component RcnA